MQFNNQNHFTDDEPENIASRHSQPVEKPASRGFIGGSPMNL